MKSLAYITVALLFFSCIEEPIDLVDPSDIEDWKYIKPNDGLTDNNVLDIYFDDPNYWFATANGLTFYDGRSFDQFTENDVLLDPFITSIGKDVDGDLWFGSGNGLVIYDGSSWFQVPALGGFNLIITDIEEGNNGDLYFATANLGVLIYDGQQFFQVFDSNCNECNDLNKIHQDNEGNIWVGSVLDLKKYDSKWQIEDQYYLNVGLMGSNVKAIHSDSNGIIWIGYQDSNFITQISNGKSIHLEIIKGYDGVPIPVWAFANGPSNELWIGTLVNNILYYDGVVNRTLFEGPDHPVHVLSMLRHDNKLVIGTDDGVTIHTIF